MSDGPLEVERLRERNKALGSRIGYDELLDSRVKQLQAIDDNLERIGKKAIRYDVTVDIRSLRSDIKAMIRVAKEESAAF